MSEGEGQVVMVNGEPLTPDIEWSCGPPERGGKPGSFICYAYRKDGNAPKVEVVRFYDSTLYYRRVPVWCWWLLFCFSQGAASGAAVLVALRWGG